MIKLVYCLRRRADITTEHFYHYWRTTHADKVRSIAQQIGAVRYIQSHTIEPDLNESLLESRGLAPAYDGITEVWWESAQVLRAALATRTGAGAMQLLLEDESTFIDFSQSRVFMTREIEIFDLRR